MASEPDFDGQAVYGAVLDLTRFVYELEERFPQDELGVLFARLKAAAVDVGARIAEGYARDGLDAGGLSETTRREARGKLAELRHYVLVSHGRFFLDELHLRKFEELYARILGDLGRREAGRT